MQCLVLTVATLQLRLDGTDRQRSAELQPSKCAQGVPVCSSWVSCLDVGPRSRAAHRSSTQEVEHSPAQHIKRCPAQHSTAQHSTAQQQHIAGLVEGRVAGRALLWHPLTASEASIAGGSILSLCLTSYLLLKLVCRRVGSPAMQPGS